MSTATTTSPMSVDTLSRGVYRAPVRTDLQRGGTETPGKGPVVEREQERVAAEIRAIVTDELLTEELDMHWTKDKTTLKRALVLCAHLRADRTPEAIYAHGPILSEVQRELADYGAPAGDRPHVKILELLCEYIEHDFYLWHDGQWQQDEAGLGPTRPRASA